MKSTTIARLLLVPLVLLAMGCGEPLDAQPSSCRPSGIAIACTTSLDACIVEGHGSCDVGAIGQFGDLVLSSDGVTARYTYQRFDGSTGTWGRVDRTVDLHPDDGGPDVTIELVEGGVSL